MTQPHLDPLINIELLAAACVLAPHVFYARGEAFGVSGVWTMLDAAERQRYINECVDLLRRLAPMRRITYPKAVNP